MSNSTDVQELEDRFKRMSQCRDGTLRRENYFTAEHAPAHSGRTGGNGYGGSGYSNGYGGSGYSNGYGGSYSNGYGNGSGGGWGSFWAADAAQSTQRPGLFYGGSGSGAGAHSPVRSAQRSWGGGGGDGRRPPTPRAAGPAEGSFCRSHRYSGGYGEMPARGFGHRGSNRDDEDDDDGDSSDEDSYSYLRSHPQLSRDLFNGDVVDGRDRLPASHPYFAPHESARPFNCRWVNDGGASSAAVRDVHTPQNGAQQKQCVSPNPSFSQVRPSTYFMRLVEDVAAKRNVCVPPIPPEVTIAFDNFVFRGTSMLKFVSSGPPHERFFVIKFFGNAQALESPDSVFCWYTTSQAWTLRRFFSLSCLIGVIRGCQGHPAIRKRITKRGLIKGSRVNFRVNYIRPEYILQFQFSSFDGQEERIAVKLLSREAYVAWYIVTDFFSKIGFDGTFSR